MKIIILHVLIRFHVKHYFKTKPLVVKPLVNCLVDYAHTYYIPNLSYKRLFGIVLLWHNEINTQKYPEKHQYPYVFGFQLLGRLLKGWCQNVWQKSWLVVSSS
jgi:hypothetical protein